MPPNRLPKLPSAAAQLDDGLSLPINQLHHIYKPKDARKIQSLDPVFTLDDLRRAGVVGTRNIQSSLAYPGLSPNFLNEPLEGVTSDDEPDEYEDSNSDECSNSETVARGNPKGPPRSPSPEQVSSGRIDPQHYNATTAARVTLLHEKPSVVERMEKGVAACAVLKDNRRFRLFSLGVFQPAVNDVRTRSMHHVELHKHLSSTNLRAPQPDKEVRSAVHSDTVASRLDRMYHRVMRSVEDSAPPSPPLGGLAGMAGGLALGGGGGFGSGGTAANGGRRPSPMSRVTIVSAPGAGTGRASFTRRPAGEGEVRSGPGQQQQQQQGHSQHQFHYQPQQHQQQQAGNGQQGVGPGAADSTGRPQLLARSSSIIQRTAGLSMPGGTLGASAGGGIVGPGTIGGGGGVSGGGAPRSLFNTPSLSRSPSLLPQQAQQPQVAQAPGSPNAAGTGPGGGAARTGQVHSADYWMRVTLPPEVIEAQLRHLAATTEANLRMYHDKVAAAQNDLLRSNGLGGESLGMPADVAEQSLRVKLGQIQEDTTVNNNYNYSSLSREAVVASSLSRASKQLLTATSLQQFIKAALEHAGHHAGQLNDIKTAAVAAAAQKQPDDGRRRQRRVRAKSSIASLSLLSGTQPTTVSSPGPTLRVGDSARTFGSDPTTFTSTSGTPPSGTSTGDDTQDDSSEASGMWPSYGAVSMKQRAMSVGSSLLSAQATQSQLAAAAKDSDADLAHLAHLRRTASPESANKEPRWSPPPPVLAGSVRAPSVVMQPLPQVSSQQPGRRLGTFIDEEWMANLNSELEAVERSTQDSPPDGLLPLPPLPASSMDAGDYVRCRLERLWSLLGMTPLQQLDLVLAFTGRDRAMQFARNLEMWEQAAVAVLGREAQVEALVAAQREIEEGRAEMLSLSGLFTMCVRVLRQTRWVEELSARLHAACGWGLSYRGAPYPGSESISAVHLLAFMEQLRQVTQISGLRP